MLPQNAFDQPLTFRVTNAQGVDVPFAQVRREGNVAVLTARGDGKMYLRATASNGAEHARKGDRPDCYWRPTKEEAKAVLDQVVRKDATILCKASRGMALEELVSYIQSIRPETQNNG